MNVFAAPFWASVPFGCHMYLIYFLLRPAWIAGVLGDICSIVRNTPSLLFVIRRHFPRPRLLRAFLDMAFLPNDAVSRQSRQKEWRIPEWNLKASGAWIIVDLLESTSSIDRQCSRRGCRNRRVARCRACKSVKYCGIECQSRCVSFIRMPHLMIIHEV